LRCRRRCLDCLVFVEPTSCRVEGKLKPLRVVSNSLIVDDPGQIAIVRDPGGSVVRHLCWEIYLPPVGDNESFVLCLAQDPDSTPELPAVEEERVQKFPIPSGTHEVTFMARDEQERPYVYELKLNGKILTEFQYETRNIADWELFFESSTVQQPADQPLMICPTSWKKDFESYLWIQKIKR